MNRNTFIQKIAGAFLLAVPAYALLNCSTSEDNNNNNNQQGGGADCLANGTNSTIGSNHGHTLTVPVADIQAAVDKTYDIDGGANHPHQVTITAAQFGELASNQQITATSTNNNSHTHSVTVSCA